MRSVSRLKRRSPQPPSGGFSGRVAPTAFGRACGQPSSSRPMPAPAQWGVSSLLSRQTRRLSMPVCTHARSCPLPLPHTPKMPRPVLLLPLTFSSPFPVRVSVCSLTDQWVDFACASITSGLTFEPTLASLDNYLSSRTFFVGYSLTLADVAVWHALVSARQWEVAAKKAAEKLPHLLRWFNHVSAACPALSEALAKFQPQQLAKKAAKKEIHAAAAAGGGGAGGDGAAGGAGGAKAAGEGGSFDIDLKDAEMGKARPPQSPLVFDRVL